MTVLTIDLGTSATKAALWSGTDLVDLVRVTIPTDHPEPGLAEQDPEHWWEALADACTALRSAAPAEYAQIDSLGCSAARETFVCVDRGLNPLSPGILWSDTRGSDQVESFGDPLLFRRQTGVLLSGGCQAAKVAWVRDHEPTWFEDANWILSPRDFVLARLTGTVQTDRTLASRTGFYTLSGELVADSSLAKRLPPIISSLQPLLVSNSRNCALPTGTTAILGAGDRACEVIGVGATATSPMVSWGTTVNVSVPHPGPPGRISVAQVSRAANGEYLVEAGLSAGGSAFDWLANLTGWSSHRLLAAAADVAPGANGILAFPWINGARAPWWHPNARAAFVGVTSAHGPPDLARALIEGIAMDTARSLETLTVKAKTILVSGAGARNALWNAVLAAMSGCSVTVRTHTEAATVGARVLLARANGGEPDLEKLNPVRTVDSPQPELVRVYHDVREESDGVARALLGEA